MRIRQKMVISLLLRAPSKPNRTQLMKWLFLLRQEGGLGEGCAFYDFLPYRYGPYSFEAHNELDGLTRSGIVEDAPLRIRPKAMAAARAAEHSLPPAIQQAIEHLLRAYGSWPTKKLLASVYERYPWYASRSELQASLVPRAAALRAVYTIGYEGRTLDRFLDCLLQTGIETLVDVRSNPFSRKYGFSQDALRLLTAKVGVRYVSLPELGVDSELRKDMAADGARQRLLDYYEHEILPEREGPVERAGQLLKDDVSALMCFEADARDCHRGRLAKRLVEVTGLPLVNL